MLPAAFPVTTTVPEPSAVKFDPTLLEFSILIALLDVISPNTFNEPVTVKLPEMIALPV